MYASKVVALANVVVFRYHSVLIGSLFLCIHLFRRFCFIFEKLQLELETVQTDHSKLKEKHDAAKARNQILSKELKSMKSQISTLLEKGKHDDDLISALMVCC